jgi:hypothetical protein
LTFTGLNSYTQIIFVFLGPDSFRPIKILNILLDSLKRDSSQSLVAAMRLVGFIYTHTFWYSTLSVLRIFVHSISCNFSCQKLCNSNFFCEITTFTSRPLSFDSFFSSILTFYDFKPNFLLEVGQILQRSQWIQIL